MVNGLTEGRIVHYVLPTGEHRPALVVRDWKEATGSANLYVFLDGGNDHGESLRKFGGTPVVASDYFRGIWWMTSVHCSDAHEPGTWHWPERED